MADHPPVLMWFRRDLRLADNRALAAAIATEAPVIPVFVLDEGVDCLGAAARFRLGLGVAHLAKTLEQAGSRLILRRGPALEALKTLVAETGATELHYLRAYDPISQTRDRTVKSTLQDHGLKVQSHKGHVLFEPWTVETKTGGFYRVFTPMWKSVRGADLPEPIDPPTRLHGPADWPASDDLADWAMDAPMRRGARILEPHTVVGEQAARDRLRAFIDERVQDYAAARDLPAINGTSGLSENLTWGEISPLACWHSGLEARRQGKQGAETFVKELVWREFAYHLLHHTPEIATRNWRPEWDTFPWNTDETAPEVIAWKQGRTGIPFVDAAMRQMYVTGTMHNRGRMIVASYLTKHLMTHWKIGMDWFAECLIDWDPASNAMGWQWSSGSGPDASPYFRVFNPVSQLDKFDKNHDYVAQWIAEGKSNPSDTALSYFDAIPKAWGVSPDAAYPDAIVSPQEGRDRALAAYQDRKLGDKDQVSAGKT